MNKISNILSTVMVALPIAVNLTTGELDASAYTDNSISLNNGLSLPINSNQMPSTEEFTNTQNEMNKCKTLKTPGEVIKKEQTEQIFKQVEKQTKERKKENTKVKEKEPRNNINLKETEKEFIDKPFEIFDGSYRDRIQDMRMRVSRVNDGSVLEFSEQLPFIEEGESYAKWIDTYVHIPDGPESMLEKLLVSLRDQPLPFKTQIVPFIYVAHLAKLIVKGVLCRYTHHGDRKIDELLLMLPWEQSHEAQSEAFEVDMLSCCIDAIIPSKSFRQNLKSCTEKIIWYMCSPGSDLYWLRDKVIKSDEFEKTINFVLEEDEKLDCKAVIEKMFNYFKEGKEKEIIDHAVQAMKSVTERLNIYLQIKEELKAKALKQLKKK